MTDMLELAKRCQDATVRFERVIPVALALAGGQTNSDGWLEQIAENLEEDPEHPFYSELPCLKVFAGGDEYPDPESVEQVLMDANLSGYLAEVSHPVMTFWADGSACYSWGNYNFVWVYSETMDGLVDKAIAWAFGLDEKRKAKAAS